MDILRLAIRTSTVNEHFFNPKDGQEFLQFLMKLGSLDGPPANTMLVLRTLTNAFKQSAGQTVLLANRDAVIPSLLMCKNSGNKNIHVAVASILLNYAIAFNESVDIEGKCQCLNAAAEVLGAFKDGEAHFRLLVCLGTLMFSDDNSIAIANSLGLNGSIGKLRSVTDPAKVGDCARHVYNLMT